MKYLLLVLYYVLLWLRVPVVLIGNLTSGIFGLAFVCWFFVSKGDIANCWHFALLSFIAFVAVWAYDSLILLISPDNVALVK